MPRRPIKCYLTLRPGVIDSYVQELRGDALSAGNDYSDALTAYEAAQSAPHLDDEFALQIKTAQMRTQIGDYATAISIYTSIMSSTNNDFTKSEMDYLLGEANLTLNKTDWHMDFSATPFQIIRFPIMRTSHCSNWSMRMSP